MPKTATLTLEVSQDLRDRLGRYAEQTRRSPSAVAEEGLAAFLDSEMDMQAALDAAEEDFANGRIVPHEEAMRQIRETIAKYEV